MQGLICVSPSSNGSSRTIPSGRAYAHAGQDDAADRHRRDVFLLSRHTATNGEIAT